MLKANTAANDFLYSADTVNLSNEESDEISKLKKRVEMLRPVVVEYTHNSVRTWITYKGKLTSISDGRVLWEREEVYFDAKCEYVDDMQDNPELIVDMITRAIGDIAANTVNEIQ